MEISLSGYKLNNLFDLELDCLTITSKNKTFRISVKKSRIFISNWFIFIILIIYIRFINYKHIALFFDFFSKFVEKKIASLQLDEIEIYHLKREESKIPNAKKSDFINFVFSYFDFELFNVCLLSEYKLSGKTFLFGTNIGTIYKKNYSFGKTSIFVRRVSVRFNEHFDDISTYNIIDLIGLKTCFISNLNNQETILAFPGLLNIEIINFNNEIFIKIIEDNIEKVYSGIYLSIPLLNYVFFNIKSLFINNNINSLIHNMFNWKLEILINFKRIVLELYESNRLFLTISSILLTLKYNIQNNFLLIIKLLNCCLLINSENFIKMLEFIIHFDIKDQTVKADINHLGLYSKTIHSTHLNNFIDVIEIPEMSIYINKIKYSKENLSMIFFTHIEFNSELLIIKLMASDEILFQNVEFKNDISYLLEFSDFIYFIISNNEKNVYSIFYTPRERAENKNLNLQINFNFNSNIQLIYNMINVEINVEKSQVNLTLNSNEKFLRITDFELAHYNYSYEKVSYIKVKSILFNYKNHNQSIIFQEIVAEKKNKICVLSDEISIFKTENSYNMSASSPMIYLYLDTLLNSNSMFIVFEIGYINFIFQKNIYCWKSIKIYKIIVKQSFSKDESSFYELLRIDEDSIKIHNKIIFKKYLKIYIPKLLLAINKDQIMKLVHIFSYLKKNSLAKTSKINQLNLIVTLNNTSIHYYFHSENKCTTLLAYFENGSFALSLNNKFEIDINSKFNRVEIMAGEIRIDNNKIIKLPHYNETFYSKLHNRSIYCDIVYYEIMKKTKTYSFMDKNEIRNSNLKEKIFPIFISSIDISHNFHIKLRKNTKMKVFYNINKDYIPGNSNSVSDKILILIDVHDYVKSNKTFYSNNFGDNKYKLLKFLEKVNDICLFEIRFQFINMLLMKTQFESKYLIFNLHNILFSNITSFELCIEKFKILIKYPSNHSSGEYVNIIINDNLIKANLEILDSKMVFCAERLIFNLNFLIKEFECQIEAIQLKISKNLINVVTDIAFISAANHQKNELYSIKYYQGVNSFNYLLDMRQSPAFVNNLILLSNEEVSITPYFHINCLSNAKFNIRNIEIPLFHYSVYLLDLNNSFFDKIYSSYNKPFYSRYFNENTYSINCKIDLGVNLNCINSEIPHSNLCKFSTSSVTVGLKICFSSKVFKDLILFFGSEVPTYSDKFERAFKIKKNQKIEIPFDLIAVYPNLMVLKDINTINGIDFDLVFSQNNSVNIIGIIKNVIKNSETFFLNYNSINSSFCIGFECNNYGGSCININIFNTLSIINISGESLSFSFCNAFISKLEHANTIENLRQKFIDNIDTNTDSVLLIKDSMEIINKFHIEFNKVCQTENHNSTNENIIKLNETESQINSKNYRLSLVKDKISFIIIVWSPLLILNYSNFRCLLKVINLENQEYYLLGGKISKNNSRNLMIRKNFNNKNIFSFAKIDQKDFVELKIQMGCYISTSSPSRQRENNILIEIEDYKHLIRNNFIISILERYSIQIKVVKLMPIWSIRNKSSFNIKITYGKYVNIPIKSNIGYLDNTSLICGKNFNYNIQEQIKIIFDEFINFFLINLTKYEPYEKLINLYRNDEIPNKEWKLVKISFYPIKNGSVSNFNTGIYIELSDFNQSESSNYFVFENKTNFTYLLTQTNDLLDFNSLDINIHRKENLAQKIWEKTLIEKYSQFAFYDNTIFRNKFSICLVPEQIENQLFFWAKDRIQDDNSPLTVSFYDKSNNTKVILEQIPAYLWINGGTKLIEFNYYDSDGNNNICQFLLSVFKFENEVTHIVFHESSFIQTHYTIFPPFLIQRQVEYQLTAKEEITKNYILNIRKFELIMFNDIDSDQVLKVKWTSTPNNSPKGSNKSLSLVPSPRKRDFIDFSPVFHILFEQLLINIKEEVDKLDLFNSVYKIHLNLNKLCCKISNYETTIFEFNNQRDKINQDQVLIIFNCFKLKKRVNNKQQFSKKYQIKDLMANIPFMDFNLNFNVYFRNFLHSFVTENQVSLKGTSEPTNNECKLIIDIFPYELRINELLINKKLRIVNCKHSINSPKRISINEFNSIINLSKHLLKNTTYTIVKTLLNKSLNPLVYF